mmetsp:Transcript_27523/g.78808  ORF Transcript_27523/g.78808 Transcript_27523/m.78808 type:complete len:111 (-) Transcript_27523:609-941(-)
MTSPSAPTRLLQASASAEFSWSFSWLAKWRAPNCSGDGSNLPTPPPRSRDCIEPRDATEPFDVERLIFDESESFDGERVGFCQALGKTHFCSSENVETFLLGRPEYAAII